MNTIPYFQTINPTLATGAQPTPTQLQELRDAGFTAVVNISPADARNFLKDEPDLVKRLGMEYKYFPIDCSKLHPDQYTGFKESVESVIHAPSSKVFVHCGMNVKSSGFMHIYRIKELKQDRLTAEADLKQTPGHEPKWKAYWASFGIEST